VYVKKTNGPTVPTNPNPNPKLTFSATGGLLHAPKLKPHFT